MSRTARLLFKRLIHQDCLLNCNFSSLSAVHLSRHVPRSRTHAAKADIASDRVDGSPTDKSLVKALEESRPNIRQLFEDIEGNDKLFSKTISSLNSRKLRERKGEILLEGRHLIELSIACGNFPEKIFYSKENAIPNCDFSNSGNTVLLKVSSRALRTLSGAMDPPTVVAVCKKPRISCSNSNHIPVTILCSNVRNPENMGNIINIAAAAGCKCVLLTKGCVDPWERKVLVSAEGAQFFVPIVNNIEWSEIYNHIPAGAPVYIADSSTDIDIAESHVYSDVEYSPNGINTQSVESNLKIPCIDINAVGRCKDEETQLLRLDDKDFPCVLYSSVSFPSSDIVLYVGGETEGIDPRARELVRDSKGMSVKIPLENDMDSLNVCSALSVIIYEIKRQLEQNTDTTVKNCC